MKKFGEGQQPFHAIIDIPEGDSQELTTVTDQALNSLYGELFNLLQTHGINPTTTTNADLKQVARAVWAAVNAGNLFVDTGTANVKNLTHVKKAGFLFRDGNSEDNGFIIEFLNKTENTGAVTINVFDVENNKNHFNNVPLVNANGNELQNKALPVNSMVKAYYEYANNRFIVINIYNLNMTDALVFNSENIPLRNVTIQTVESIDSLAGLTKIHNRTVYVKSYYATQNAGGGLFIYDSSKSNINNNGTIVNGWVRVLPANILTTNDFGLKGDGTDTDVTLRLQQLASAVQDGFTVLLIGKYTINRHIVFYDKKDIEVFGVNSDIQGDPNDWTWDTTNVMPDIAWYHPRGMLLAFDCPNIVFDNLKVKGINRNNKHAWADQWQDGDCAIQGYNCPNMLTRYCELYNTWAWALSAEHSLNAKAHDNNIYDVLHQSGINIANGASDTAPTVYNNKVKNCGLYGIEFENRNPMTINCYDNNVVDCYAGIMALSDNAKVSGIIHDNSLEGHTYAIYTTNLFDENNSLCVRDNPIKNSLYGVNVVAANGIKTLGNIAQGVFDKDTFIKISPETFVAEIVTPNKILVQRSIVQEFGFKAGTEFYVNSTKFTVTATAPNTKAWAYGNTAPDWFYELSIDKSMDDSYLFKHLHRLQAKGTKSTMGFQSLGGLKNNLFSRNTADGFVYGFVKDRCNADAAYNELIENNTFINSQQADILNSGNAMGVKYTKNNARIVNIPNDMMINGNIELSDFININFGIAQSAPNASPSNVKFYSGSNKRLYAAYVGFENGVTTGNLKLTINGQTFTATTTGVNKNIALYVDIVQGVNTINITDTIGDLTYANAYITLKALSN